jgi:hypothetical protein
MMRIIDIGGLQDGVSLSVRNNHGEGEAAEQIANRDDGGIAKET